MDAITEKRLRSYQLRETDADFAIGLTEYYYGDKLMINWLDIINYTYTKTKQGVARLRVKELFMEEVVDEHKAILLKDGEYDD